VLTTGIARVLMSTSMAPRLSKGSRLSPPLFSHLPARSPVFPLFCSPSRRFAPPCIAFQPWSLHRRIIDLPPPIASPPNHYKKTYTPHTIVVVALYIPSIKLASGNNYQPSVSQNTHLRNYCIYTLQGGYILLPPYSTTYCLVLMILLVSSSLFSLTLCYSFQPEIYPILYYLGATHVATLLPAAASSFFGM
jgi:hypothetical protein